MLIYQSVNLPVLRRIPAGARRLLDVGCGGGVFGAAAKAERGCEVVGITYSEAEAAQARERLDRVEVADLDDYDPRTLGRFDCIVCSHVLEHLRQPEVLLARLRDCLAQGGILLVALPNALFWKQRLAFLRGRFRYTDGGLMDRTHVRFFDWDSADELLRQSGYRVLERQADGGFPGSRHLGGGLAPRLDGRALASWPGLFGFQFVLRCDAAA
jgi:SAM-dependent methyltransferase